MEKAKEMQENSSTPAMPRNPAHEQAEQPLASRFVPVVAHTGGRPLSSFSFVFYRPACSNSLAPFYTTQSPFCGYRFRESCRHPRRVMDVENANLSRWRPLHGRKP